MPTQNLKNHAQYVKGFHGLLFILLLLILGGSISYLIHADKEQLYPATLMVLMAVTLFVMTWYIRIFPLRAQDRAIRAEERLRYYILTQQALPESLRISQIIALRFASDAEFPALVERAVNEGLSAKTIKEAIQNWKGDYYRV
ncbi:MAG: hypothetical protein RLZZ241_257 [Bacteroidota bacterium]|jgi:hypothetical protein